MTRRTLQIHIDANRVTCGKCELVSAADNCRVFHAPLQRVDRGEHVTFRRCAPCLAAEREAGK